MQIESRTCQARLGNYAEMQLIFCKDKIHLLQYDYNNDINGFSLRKITQKRCAKHISWHTSSETVSVYMN